MRWKAVSKNTYAQMLLMANPYVVYKIDELAGKVEHPRVRKLRAFLNVESLALDHKNTARGPRLYRSFVKQKKGGPILDEIVFSPNGQYTALRNNNFQRILRRKKRWALREKAYVNTHGFRALQKPVAQLPG